MGHPLHTLRLYSVRLEYMHSARKGIPMPRASAAEAAATAARVLGAAEKRFIAQGFGAASVDDIAADAGVTRGAVYHHYDSKPGLFLAVVQRMQQQVADAVVAAAGDATSADSLRLGSH